MTNPDLRKAASGPRKLFTDDALCIGYGLERCAKCARYSPGAKTDKHLLFQPCQKNNYSMFKAVSDD
jgi:hypothetical protein